MGYVSIMGEVGNGEVMKPKPKMRLSRGWVPVTPDGVVSWRCARSTRSDSILAARSSFGTIHRWRYMYREGWRIVRCRVEV